MKWSFVKLTLTGGKHLISFFFINDLELKVSSQKLNRTEQSDSGSKNGIHPASEINL